MVQLNDCLRLVLHGSDLGCYLAARAEMRLRYRMPERAQASKSQRSWKRAPFDRSELFRFRVVGVTA